MDHFRFHVVWFFAKGKVSMLARDPDYEATHDFLDALKRRDRSGLKDLLERNPGVVWGSLYKKLSSEDQKWAMSVAEELRSESMN